MSYQSDMFLAPADFGPHGGFSSRAVGGGITEGSIVNMPMPQEGAGMTGMASMAPQQVGPMGGFSYPAGPGFMPMPMNIDPSSYNITGNNPIGFGSYGGPFQPPNLMQQQQQYSGRIGVDMSYNYPQGQHQEMYVNTPNHPIPTSSSGAMNITYPAQHQQMGSMSSYHYPQQQQQQQPQQQQPVLGDYTTGMPMCMQGNGSNSMTPSSYSEYASLPPPPPPATTTTTNTTTSGIMKPTGGGLTSSTASMIIQALRFIPTPNYAKPTSATMKTKTSSTSTSTSHPSKKAKTSGQFLPDPMNKSKTASDLMWRDRYMDMLQMATVAGTCNIPLYQPTTDPLGMSPHSELGAWLMEQRKLYREGKLLPDRQEALQRLVDGGLLTWSIVLSSTERWYMCYKFLLDFKTAHGHCDIPLDHIVVDKLTEISFNIGSWVNTQKAMYQDGKLSGDMREKIHALVVSGSMDLSIKRPKYTSPWDEKFQLLESIGKRIGNCNVTTSFTATGPDGKVHKIGSWLRTQILQYNNNSLTRDKTTKLDSLVAQGLLRIQTVGKKRRAKTSYFRTCATPDTEEAKGASSNSAGAAEVVVSDASHDAAATTSGTDIDIDDDKEESDYSVISHVSADPSY